MASVTVNLGLPSSISPSQIQWFFQTGLLLGDVFSFTPGVDQSLRDVRLFVLTGGVNVDMDSVRRFTPEFEATGRFIFEASDGEVLEIMIANADMTDPYKWTPVNSDEVIAFANHVRGLTDPGHRPDPD